MCLRYLFRTITYDIEGHQNRIKMRVLGFHIGCLTEKKKKQMVNAALKQSKISIPLIISGLRLKENYL